MADAVNHPSYYGGEDNTYECVRVIEAWDLNFSLGNAVKYISRAGKKDPATMAEDLEKAAWYLNREIVKARGFLPDRSVHPDKYEQVGEFSWARTEGQPEGMIHWTMNDRVRPDNCEMPDFRKDPFDA